MIPVQVSRLPLGCLVQVCSTAQGRFLCHETGVTSYDRLTSSTCKRQTQQHVAEAPHRFRAVTRTETAKGPDAHRRAQGKPQSKAHLDASGKARENNTRSREDIKLSRRFQTESFAFQFLSPKHPPHPPPPFICRNQSTSQSRSAERKLVQGRTDAVKTCAAKLLNCPSSTVLPLQSRSQGLQVLLRFLRHSPAELSIMPPPRHHSRS